MVVVVAAGPAAADDVYDIDGRLQEAGLVDAVVDVVEADGAPRVVVDFDVREETADAAEYRAQALQAAELVWDHLEVRVGALDVQPTYRAPWLASELPATVSFTRADLEAGFGPRPAGLDATTDPYADDGDTGGVVDYYVDPGGLLLPVLIGVVVLLLVVVGLLVALLVRGRSGAPAAGGWGGAAPPGAGPGADGDPWRAPPR